MRLGKLRLVIALTALLGAVSASATENREKVSIRLTETKQGLRATAVGVLRRADPGQSYFIDIALLRDDVVIAEMLNQVVSPDAPVVDVRGEAGERFLASLDLERGRVKTTLTVNGLDFGAVYEGRVRIDEFTDGTVVTARLSGRATAFLGDVNAPGVESPCVQNGSFQFSVCVIQFTESPAGVSPLLGQLVETGGTVTEVTETGSGNVIYFQDPLQNGAWSGLRAFFDGTTPPVNVGDSISLAGIVDEFRGNTQLVDPVISEVAAGELIVPAPLTVGEANSEDFEGVLVTLRDLTILESADFFGQLIVSDGTGILLVSAATSGAAERLLELTNGSTVSLLRGVIVSVDADPGAPRLLLVRSVDDIIP